MQFMWPGTPVTVTVGRQDVSWGTGCCRQGRQPRPLQGRPEVRRPELSVGYTYDKYTEVFGAPRRPTGIDDNAPARLGAIGTRRRLELRRPRALRRERDQPRTSTHAQRALDGFAIGKVGPVDLKAEVAYVVGKNDSTTRHDHDVAGLGAYVGAAMPVGPVTLGLEGAYAAGDDPDTATRTRVASAPTTRPVLVDHPLQQLRLQRVLGRDRQRGHQRLPTTTA